MIENMREVNTPRDLKMQSRKPNMTSPRSFQLMPPIVILTTPRLRLRQWSASDLEPWAALNSDPRVMEYFPAMLDAEASRTSRDRIVEAIEKQGWGLWAAERLDTGAFIGFIGLQHPRFEPFLGDVEIGWRLAYEHWGQAFAPEGALAALSFAFESLGLERVISMTTRPNLRSMRVMEKLGMVRVPEADFDHPRVPEGHPLRRHVLYTLERADLVKSVRSISP